MPLKDYTTGVSSHRTVGEITELLVKAGARGVAQEFDTDGRIVGLEFAVVLNGEALRYTLPVRASAVQGVLARQRVDRKYQTDEHAERVAWRIMRDWVAAQLAIIETQMVTFDQVMLPYLRTDDGSTMFERYVAQRALSA